MRLLVQCNFNKDLEIKTMGKSGRFRPFAIIFYGTQEELIQIIRTYRESIAHYAYITHDKDVYEEDLFNEEKQEFVHKKGEIEKVHIHILVDFFNGHTITAVKRMFTTELDKPRVEVIGDRVAQFRYLTHKDNPEKYQYPDSDITADDINYYEKLCITGDKIDGDNKAELIINDLLRGISPRIMVARYGRDFVIHMKQYEECAQAIKFYDFNENARKAMEADRKLNERIEKQLEMENPFKEE